VTEYLRDKLADAEETLKSGGGDTRLLQQRLAAMEAEVSQAVRLGAEVDYLRSQLQDKDDELASMRSSGGHDAQAELRGQLQATQERVRALEKENAIITRERELGISAVGGSVSQERYDQLVAENKRLFLQLERGEVDAGGLGSADLEELKALKRDVKKMKQQREDLQQKYEDEVARRRQLEEQGPLGGLAAENPTTIRELREKMAQLVVENKRLNATAQGSHQVMVDAQSEVERVTIQMDELRLEKDSEIAALTSNIEQARQDWGKEKKHMEWEQREENQHLQEALTHERNDNQKLTGMLEEVATTLENEVKRREHWEHRAHGAEQALHTACELQGIEVPDLGTDYMLPQPVPGLGAPSAFDAAGYGGSAPGYGQLAAHPEEGLPPPQHQYQPLQQMAPSQSGYSYAGQPQQLGGPPQLGYGYAGQPQQQPQHQYAQDAQSMASYQPGMQQQQQQQQQRHVQEAPPQTMFNYQMPDMTGI
jgi:hypothetical protein